MFNSVELFGFSRLCKIVGNDGGDDEEDEDVINLDFDDLEDDEGDLDVDDEGFGYIMFCMYDKV